MVAVVFFFPLLATMLLTTTNHIENRPVTEYKGIVSGEVIIGANFVKDIFASFRDFFGGRADSYERVLREAKEKAMEEMIVEARILGADAIIGIDLDYETLGQRGSMLMVSATGTAVKF